MKKILAIVLSLVIGLATMVSLAGCSDNAYTPDGKRIVRVHVPQQTPSVTILKLLYEKEQIDDTKYQVEYVLEEGQLINGSMGQKTPDVVIAPTNFIAQHYFAEGNAKSEYQIAAATSFGAFYLLTVDGTTSFDELEGKEITCQGGAAGASARVLNHLLTENDFEDVTVRYEAQASLIIQDIKEGNIEIALLPEPALTNVKNAVASTVGAENINIINIQNIWLETEGEDGYPMASLAFKKSFLEEYGDFCTQFARKVKESVEWVTSETPSVRSEVLTALATLRTRDDGALDTLVSDAVFTDAIGRFNIGFKLAGEQGVEEAIRKYLSTIEPALVIPANTDIFYKQITLTP